MVRNELESAMACNDGERTPKYRATPKTSGTYLAWARRCHEFSKMAVREGVEKLVDMLSI